VVVAPFAKNTISDRVSGFRPPWYVSHRLSLYRAVVPINRANIAPSPEKPERVPYSPCDCVPSTLLPKSGASLRGHGSPEQKLWEAALFLRGSRGRSAHRLKFLTRVKIDVS